VGQLAPPQAFLSGRSHVVGAPREDTLQVPHTTRESRAQ